MKHEFVLYLALASLMILPAQKSWSAEGILAEDTNIDGHLVTPDSQTTYTGGGVLPSDILTTTPVSTINGIGGRGGGQSVFVPHPKFPTDIEKGSWRFLDMISDKEISQGIIGTPPEEILFGTRSCFMNPVQKIPAQDSFFEKDVKRAMLELQQIKPLNDTLATTLLERLSELTQESYFVEFNLATWLPQLRESQRVPAEMQVPVGFFSEFSGKGVLLISKPVYNQLNEEDRAAFLIHETLRQYKITNLQMDGDLALPGIEALTRIIVNFKPMSYPTDQKALRDAMVELINKSLKTRLVDLEFVQAKLSSVESLFDNKDQVPSCEKILEASRDLSDISSHLNFNNESPLFGDAVDLVNKIYVTMNVSILSHWAEVSTKWPGQAEKCPNDDNVYLIGYLANLSRQIDVAEGRIRNLSAIYYDRQSRLFANETMARIVTDTRVDQAIVFMPQGPGQFYMADQCM